MAENIKKESFLTLRSARDIIVTCLIFVATWKLINTDLSIPIDKFSFTDLLSILVSFFSIGLSIAFYFKATDTSNNFYDNSYKFTKEISEILGRIEAGFGEKLKHIDEGYLGIKNRFDQIPFDFYKAKDEIEAEKREVNEKEQEKFNIFEDLANKANLAVSEKNEIFEKFQAASRELDVAKKDLFNLEQKLINNEPSRNSPMQIRSRVLRYIALKIMQRSNIDDIKDINNKLINDVFLSIKDSLPSQAISDMRAINYIDEINNLTPIGTRAIAQEARHIFH